MYYILEYHYFGQTTLPNLEVLLLFANAVKELEIDELINTVKDKISRSVNAETCVPIMQRSPPAVCHLDGFAFSESLISACQWTEPFHVAWRFALSNFEEVAKSSTFLHLDAHVSVLPLLSRSLSPFPLSLASPPLPPPSSLLFLRSFLCLAL